MNAERSKRFINFRPLLFAAVGLIMGITAYVALWNAYSIPGVSYTTVLLMAVLIAALILLIILCSIRRRAMLLTIAAAMLAGMARTAIAMPQFIPMGVHSISGIVYDYVTDEANLSVTLKGVSIDGSAVNYDACLEIAAYKSTGLSIGDRITANVWGGTPGNSDGVFNRQMLLLAKGALVEVTAKDVTVISHGNAPVRQLLHKAREGIGAAIADIFGGNAPIMAGFLIGDRTEIGEDSYYVFHATGTAHLLALSGFHVGVLSGFLLMLLPKQRPWLRFVIVGSFLLFYCALTAFSPSLIRASVMCICVLFADVVSRRRDSLSSISFAAVLLLLINPFKLWSISFLLSFSAVLGIVLTGAGRHRTPSVALSNILNGVSVSFGAGTATAILGARFFGIFSSYSILANAIAIPIYTASITMGVLLLPLYCISPRAARLLSALPNALNDAAMYVLQWISNLKYAVIEVAPPSILSCVLFLILLFTLSKYVLRPLWRRVNLAGCVMVLFTASLFVDIIKA